MDNNRITDTISKIMQEGILQYFQKLHQKIGVPIEVRKCLDRELYVAKSISPLPAAWVSEGEQLPDLQHITISRTIIKMCPFYLKITEGVVESLNENDLVDMVAMSISNAIYGSDMKPAITTLQRDKSIIAIGNCRARLEYDSLTYEAVTPVGIGLSQEVFNKIKSKCKAHCPRYIKCILHPKQPCEWSNFLKVAHK